jgi:hypothetical protein
MLPHLGPYLLHGDWWNYKAVIQHFTHGYTLEQQITYRVSSQMKIYWLIKSVKTRFVTHFSFYENSIVNGTYGILAFYMRLYY